MNAYSQVQKHVCKSWYNVLVTTYESHVNWRVGLDYIVDDYESQGGALNLIQGAVGAMEGA